jgi:hypothetical protein
MAMLGGLGMCLITFYAVIYLPLHYHESINYGDSLQFGDVLAFASGSFAFALGLIALNRLRRLPTYSGGLLLAAGLPTLILAGVWSFPTTFHLAGYPTPFYIGYVYFANLGIVRIGAGAVPVPLLAASALVAIAGITALVSRPPTRAA